MKLETLASQLDEIEAEMKHLGLLSAARQPMPEITSAFGYGQVPFEQWLSDVFLLKVRAALESDALPSDSQVAVAAMRNFDGDDRMSNLVSLLSTFDQSIRTYARTRANSTASAGVSSSWLRRLWRKRDRDA